MCSSRFVSYISGYVIIQLHSSLSQEPDMPRRYRGTGIPVVYTDSACVKNGRKDAKAGIGVYWGMNDTRYVRIL